MVPELGGGLLFELFEFPVEIGEVVEPASKRDFRDLKVFSLFQKPAGLANPDLEHKIDIGLVGALFEISAECIWRHAGYLGDLRNRKPAVVVRESVFHDLAHPVSFFLSEAFFDEKRRNGNHSAPTEDLQQLDEGKKAL